MSIPKEPRQLMINIMYLVLTALLALNVSAEVFNAFKIVDKGLMKSNSTIDIANASMVIGIRKAAKKKASYAKYPERIDSIQLRANALTTYIEDIVEQMIDDNGTGGYLESRDQPGTYTDELKKARDFDVTTRVLVMDHEGNPGKGEELKAKLLNYKQEILQFINAEDRSNFEGKVTVQVDDKTWKEKDKASWSHMHFDHMPLQAVIPILRKYINDVKSTEAAALNYLARKVGAGEENLFIEDYKVVSAPKKSYVIKGDDFVTNLFVGAASGPDSKTGIQISVDGQNIPIKNGLAQFTTKANRSGEHNYTVTANITNPVTQETKTYTDNFFYEVGERSVAASASKMNVFYIGVDNPVEISAAGVPSHEIQVSMEGGGGRINKLENSQYNVRVSKATKRNEYVYLNIKTNDMVDRKPFRVKRIPDPIPKLSNSRSGGMPSGEFKLQQGIRPDLEYFDFEASCDITEFRIIRKPKLKDPEVYDNKGGRFDTKAKSIIAKARASDKYYFENIRCKCPGDQATRNLGLMVFNIQ